MDHPEITVTMPAYNRADLIGRAIESVQSQTMSSWELVIVDATLEIARGYANNDGSRSSRTNTTWVSVRRAITR